MSWVPAGDVFYVFYDTWVFGFFSMITFSRVVCKRDYFWELQMSIRITRRPP